MAELEFPHGLRVYKPTAPDFIIADIDIETSDLMAWLHSRGTRVKLQIRQSKAGGYYCCVNNYKEPQEQQELNRLFDEK